MPNTADLIRRTINVERTRRGLTQGQLAARIPMTETALSSRMTGRVPLDLADIDRIAAALDMTSFELIESARSEAISSTAAAS
jgi:transcriptional regulator with XRE-family HTH domain